jgi:hypothetical protein
MTSTNKPVISDQAFAAAWNDHEELSTVRDVAQKLGYSYGTTKKRASKIRKAHAEKAKSAPYLIDRSAGLQVSIIPELMYDQTPRKAAELKELLYRMQAAQPGKNITRIHFRNETRIADSVWLHHFGTFLEFRRQSGLELSRSQHQVTRQVAKHVAADHYRDFNDRRELDDRYLKDTKRPIKTIIGCSDLHDVEVDPFFLRVLKESVKLVSPDVLNFGGDIFDLPEFGKFSVDPREWDVTGRIKFAHEHIFKPIREAHPDLQIDFVEGNHEYRLLRHLADASPAMKSLLADLHGLTVSQLLGLDKFEINYIAKADLGAFTKAEQSKQVQKSYKVYDNTLLIHHHPHARNWGLSGWNGHHHRVALWNKASVMNGNYQWFQLGCGHKLSASYCEGEHWDQGFMIAHYNTLTGSVNQEYIKVTDMAIVGGVYFYRRPDEMVGAYAKAL